MPKTLTCNKLIDLQRPLRSERVRDFQPPWRTVFVYRCTCGNETRMRASAYRGRTAEPSTGAVRCGHKLPDLKETSDV